jgi:hypothetical protein
MAFEGESLEKGDLTPEERDLSLELQSNPRYVLEIDLICGCGKWV